MNLVRAGAVPPRDVLPVGLTLLSALANLCQSDSPSLLADPAALRGLAEARESEQAGDVVYGAEAARALLAERKR